MHQIHLPDIETTLHKLQKLLGAKHKTIKMSAAEIKQQALCYKY